MWFLDQLEPGSTHYNIPAAVRLGGRLDVGALRRSVSEVVRRHEVLRTRFEIREGQPVQVVEEEREVGLGVVDLSEVGGREGEQLARAIGETEAGRGFDLEHGPVVRGVLLRRSEEEHVLLLSMHHIVSDGWSTGVLVRELTTLYEAYRRGEESPLEELGVQYGDYARWQREWLKGGGIGRAVGVFTGGSSVEGSAAKSGVADGHIRGRRCRVIGVGSETIEIRGRGLWSAEAVEPE